MFDRIRRRRRRNQEAVPGDLPPTVRFDVIDYDGERLYLAVPIEAVVVIEEDDDIFLLNGETYVYGIGPTLEDAMEDFCGSFLLCYKIMIKYGPGTSNWNQIMLHVYGWRRNRTDGTPTITLSSRTSHLVLMFRASFPTRSLSIRNIAGPHPVPYHHVRQDP